MATDKRGKALVAWILAVEPEYSLPLRAIEDCYDPVLLAGICQTVDSAYFEHVIPNRDDALSLWERTDGIKCLVDVIEQYFHDTIGQKTWTMPPIDIHGIAQQNNELALIDLLVVIISMAVLSPEKEAQINKIQTTPEWVQKELMLCIEEVRSTFPSPDLASPGTEHGPPESLASFVDLQAAHETLQNALNSSQQELESLKLEHGKVLRTMDQATDAERIDQEGVTSANVHKLEVDRLQAELSKYEQVIADSEITAANQEKTVANLTKEIAELTLKADQADKIKDELDEYRHAAEKARKLEAAVEKYKKKLEDATETRRALKNLEEENAVLLDKNVQLEEDIQKLGHLSEINVQYKQTISNLETKASRQAQEIEALQSTADNVQKQNVSLKAERDRQAHDIAVLEERLKQVEGQPKRTRYNGTAVTGDTSPDSTDDEDSARELSGMANELDDAMSGTSTTELKLRIRKLERQLETSKNNEADSSRVGVLENLLDDAERMKTRYEQEFLKEHKEKLVLQRQMDEIRSGKSASSNETEANVALRIRLAEAIDELDHLHKESAGNMNRLAQLEAELKLAQADLRLVDKSRTEILTEVRKSVETEQSNTANDLKRVQEELYEAKQTISMHLSQINSLLLDKVDLQDQNISQRDAASRNEIVDATASEQVSGEAARLTTEVMHLRESLDQTKEQLKKARIFIRQQDKLFKEQHQAQVANGDRQHEIETLRAEIIKQKALQAELEQRHQAEQQLLLRAFQETGLDKLRSEVLANGQAMPRAAPVSWLAQQRARTLKYVSADSR